MAASLQEVADGKQCCRREVTLVQSRLHLMYKCFEPMVPVLTVPHTGEASQCQAMECPGHEAEGAVSHKCVAAVLDANNSIPNSKPEIICREVCLGFTGRGSLRQLHGIVRTYGVSCTGSGMGSADASAQASATAKATAQAIANAVAQATNNNAQVSLLHVARDSAQTWCMYGGYGREAMVQGAHIARVVCMERILTSQLPSCRCLSPPDSTLTNRIALGYDMGALRRRVCIEQELTITARLQRLRLEACDMTNTVLQATAAASASDLQTAIATAFASSQSSVSSTGGILMPYYCPKGALVQLYVTLLMT